MQEEMVVGHIQVPSILSLGVTKGSQENLSAAFIGYSLIQAKTLTTTTTTTNFTRRVLKKKIRLKLKAYRIRTTIQ